MLGSSLKFSGGTTPTSWVNPNPSVGAPASFNFEASKVNPAGNAQGNKMKLMTSRDKKFLPGRPSLHDILLVAPQWKEAFETLCKTMSLRDAQIQQIRDVTQNLKEKNEAQKELIKERVKTACTDIVAEDALFSEIEAQQPIVRKWRRQVNALSAAFQRMLGSDKVTPQPLIVPQSDYLRFIDELQTRFKKLEKRALCIEQSSTILRQELQGETPPIDVALKNILTGFVNQYKLLKYFYLAQHEELQSSIERYKYSHPHNGSLDQQLEDSLRTDGNACITMLTSISKPLPASSFQISTSETVPPNDASLTSLRTCSFK